MKKILPTITVSSLIFSACILTNAYSPIIKLKPESLSALEKTEPIINLNDNFKIINLYLKQVKILKESSVNPKSDVVNEMVYQLFKREKL